MRPRPFFRMLGMRALRCVRPVRWLLVLGLLMPALLVGCAYQWQGVDSPATPSVLGDGSKTVKIGSVEQSTLYPWVPYYIRSIMRDELNLRKLATWVDSGSADYVMDIKMPIFQVRSFARDQDDITLLNSAQVDMEIILYHGNTGTEYWRSGIITYSERYENPRADIAIQEVLVKAVRRTLDSMQKVF